MEHQSVVRLALAEFVNIIQGQILNYTFL